MAYIDRNKLVEYNFDGTFYVLDEPLSDDLLSGGEPNERIVLTTKCDVQDANKVFSGGVSAANYNVYFPFNNTVDIEIGMLFRCSVYNFNCSGTVIGVFPSELGGCVAYVKKVGV